MRILAIGIATLDIINTVENYPPEDSEVRASGQYLARGGNATNTLVVLNRLGHRCSWGGVLAEDRDSHHIINDLQANTIDMDGVTHLPGHTPTSYIALSRQSGSRTIVHYRDLPEFTASAFDLIDLTPFDWIHFEGRNCSELEKMLRKTLASGTPCSMEIEKHREGIEQLYPLPNLLLLSRAYAQSEGFTDAASFLSSIRTRSRSNNTLTCAWGEEGAWALSRSDRLIESPAFPPARVVDTLGAGDVFNAGIIDGICRGKPLQESLVQACRLAGDKCGRRGL